jgi:hypothetical protein
MASAPTMVLHRASGICAVQRTRRFVDDLRMWLEAAVNFKRTLTGEHCIKRQPQCIDIGRRRCRKSSDHLPWSDPVPRIRGFHIRVGVQWSTRGQSNSSVSPDDDIVQIDKPVNELSIVDRLQCIRALQCDIDRISG